jgi:hypothetical protein
MPVAPKEGSRQPASDRTSGLKRFFDPRVLIGISGFKESGSTRVFWRRPELSAQPSKATFVNHVFPRALARGLWLTTIAIALVFGGSAPYCLSEPPGLGSEIPILSSDPWQAI